MKVLKENGVNSWEWNEFDLLDQAVNRQYIVFDRFFLIVRWGCHFFRFAKKKKIQNNSSKKSIEFSQFFWRAETKANKEVNGVKHINDLHLQN